MYEWDSKGRYRQGASQEAAEQSRSSANGHGAEKAAHSLPKQIGYPLYRSGAGDIAVSTRAAGKGIFRKKMRYL